MHLRAKLTALKVNMQLLKDFLIATTDMVVAGLDIPQVLRGKNEATHLFSKVSAGPVSLQSTVEHMLIVPTQYCSHASRQHLPR
mmetsp:Transcript_17255/g.24730  ORF Transcript_17255/g.24730 Transcript_17255/m.24730 type:complete len:84 (+) Transcript_17255:141-392(+)